MQGALPISLPKTTSPTRPSPERRQGHDRAHLKMDENDQESAIAEWIRRELGAEVTSIVRQPRWRPAWFIEARRPNEELHLYVRGERLDARIGFSLAHEMKLQSLLSERDIPVARVHGWIESPRAYVMDRLEGADPLNDLASADRDAVLTSYIETLARIHALDVEPFAEAGIIRAERPTDSGRIGMEVYEKAYRANKRQPDPFLEFTLSWLRRNPLPPNDRESVVLWDTGQFIQHEGRLRALIDLEIGHIGDPMMDLAGFRMRAREIGFNNFEQLYALYEEATRQPVDRIAIQHHYFSFALCNQLAFHAALAEPPAGSDYMMNLRWCVETNLYAIEALAEILGIQLQPVPTPTARVPRSGPAQGHLITWLRNLQVDDPAQSHQVRSAFRLARHLARESEIGASIEADDLNELEDVLGTRPSDWLEGERDLETFLLTAGSQSDEEMVRLFHRRLSRQLLTLGPEGSAMARHHPVSGVQAP